MPDPPMLTQVTALSHADSGDSPRPTLGCLHSRVGAVWVHTSIGLGIEHLPTVTQELVAGHQGPGPGPSVSHPPDPITHPATICPQS